MKKHAIIPIFIPHEGCPNDCIFCNQRKITARSAPVGKDDVQNIIEQYLPTLQNRGLKTIEVAFFGGSFTGIPLEQQSEYLAVALAYKKCGLVDKIHLSTRPDYISVAILENLKSYEVDVIELGVQSFDPQVLAASKRGHSVDQVYEACALIKSYDFTLGIQLMIGLPCDTMEKAVHSAKCAASIKPSIARLYPTVVLEDTALCQMYRDGNYKPLSEDEAVEISKEMYKILFSAGINIIRVGLKSTDLITNSSDLGGGYHPAFRQLVEGAIAREQMEEQLVSALSVPNRTNIHNLHKQRESHFFCQPYEPDASCHFVFVSNARSFSNMIGHKGCNKKYFAENYPTITFSYRTSDALSDYTYQLSFV